MTVEPPRMSQHSAIRPLFSAQDLSRRVRELAEEISRDAAGEDLLLIGILKGAYVLLADLARELTAASQCDFMRVALYGDGKEPGGRPEILLDVSKPVEGRHVVIVEDIVDTGITLRHVQTHLTEGKPASLRTCVLLDKPSRREVEIALDYVGFTIPDVYVVGYGLDWAEKYRDLPFVGVLEDGAAP